MPGLVNLKMSMKLWPNKKRWKFGNFADQRQGEMGNHKGGIFASKAGW